MSSNSNKGQFPLLSDQKRLWILAQQDKKNPAYNMSIFYHLTGDVDFKVFYRSIAILFDRQYAMFSVFRQKDGIPYIEIITETPKITFLDFSDQPLAERIIKINAFAGEDARKCFDIEKGPLFRLYLLKENDQSHYFLATVHHIIFDGWSKRVFVKELSCLYNNIVKKEDFVSEPLPFSVFDFAAIEESMLSNSEGEDLGKFWRDYLKDSPAELKFPYDRNRQPISTGFGNKECFVISAECTEKLRLLGKSIDASLFSIVLAFVGILLHKYTGENDICIGVPVSNRRLHSSLDELLGLFVNTTVVRIRIDERESIREYLLDAKHATRQALRHSALPFEKIVESVNPVRIPGINPLFQVALSWYNGIKIPMELTGALGEEATIKNGISPFDFTFHIWEGEGTIQGDIDYSADLMKDGTIIRLIRNFLSLIERAVENPEEKISSLSAVSMEELAQIKSYQGVTTKYPKEKTIIQLFEEQVKLHPDKIAAVFKDESITYSKLNEKASQLDQTLRKLGVGVNTPVGIMADKSLLMLTGILGILKSGAAYLPVDPEYPSERISFIIKDSGCTLLLTQDKYTTITLDGVTVLNLSNTDAYSDDKSDHPIPSASSDVAYIMYTSGTTGNPKGSMIFNYSVVRLVRNTNYLNISSDDRILLTGAIVFDATTFEIWGTLLNGATLFIAEKETILDPKALSTALKNNSITILWLTSPLFTQIEESAVNVFGNLKYLLVGGDILSAKHINKVRKENPGLKVINGYGPTENTTFSTTYLIEMDFERNIPIGKPISNSTAYIFDKNMNYQPIGVQGELYLGGDGVSKGYLNRDDLNQKCFVLHPETHNERLYRSGDYARWLDDGNIEFLGRFDNQLKIRGFRVEISEIEAALSEIDGVLDTVVKPVRLGEADIKLVGFLNVSDTFNLDKSEIITVLKKRLPQYMVPNSIKLMHGFPKTINGKIDKNLLTFDPADLIVREPLLQRKLSETEKIIQGIWSEALGTNDILITDNFFEIGGSSLMAISVFTKIESVFNLDIGLRLFFDSPHIADLAEIIDIRSGKGKIKHGLPDMRNDGSKIVEGEI